VFAAGRRSERREVQRLRPVSRPATACAGSIRHAQPCCSMEAAAARAVRVGEGERWKVVVQFCYSLAGAAEERYGKCSVESGKLAEWQRN